MILEELGVLASAKSYTTGTDQASLAHVIDLGAVANVAPSDVWIDIETYAAAVGAGAIAILVQLAEDIALTLNPLNILTVDIAAITDPRVATAGAKILRCTLPYEALFLANGTRRYLGVSVTVAGTSLGLNIAISPSKPRTDDNTQVVRSNVGVPT